MGLDGVNTWYSYYSLKNLTLFMEQVNLHFLLVHLQGLSRVESSHQVLYPYGQSP